jgi:transposase-like protein
LVKCPECGTENVKPVREWYGGKSPKRMLVQRFVCSECKKSYVAWKDSKTGGVKVMTRKTKP